MAQPSMPSRSNECWMQPLERPALLWLARHMPARVTPDMLTGVGFTGACVTAASYALSRWYPAALWLASFGLLVNWFGDSLDGSLARYRRIERPRFGYFLDQNLDALAQLLLAVGLGLSGYVRFEIAMLVLTAFFLLSILGLVQAIVSSVFELACWGVGLTEIRIGLAIFNALLFFLPPADFLGTSFLYSEALALAWAVSMLIIFVAKVAAGLAGLAAEERASWRDPPSEKSPTAS